MRTELGLSGEGLAPLSEPQINILRCLGKGMSKEQTANELHLPRRLKRELKDVFNILEVDGEVPAVIQALKLGILDVDADGLLDPDFDLEQFHGLRRSEKIVLELLIESKSTILDKKVLKEAGVETSKDITNEYVSRSLRNIKDETVGLLSRTQVLVHYFAFLNKEEFSLGQSGEQKVGNDSLKLTGQELRVLELFAKGLTASVIGNRLVQPIKTRVVYNYKRKILTKLGVTNIEMAIEKATELGILKS